VKALEPTKILRKTAILATAISFLFLISSMSVPSVMASAKGSSASLAATPLSQLEANWAAPDGNQFNHNFNPQKQVNSSNAQYLGLAWLFPLPTHPAALLSVPGGLGVDTAPLVVNGTVYFVTQFDQVFALNAANGNVIWTTVIPVSANSTAGRGIGALALHHHNGNVQFTTALFNHTPTFWVSATDWKVYAINAFTGKFELNFSIFDGPQTVQGTHTGAQYGGGVGAANLLVDQNRGILISSAVSPASPNTGRCFYRGWNINVNPPAKMWETYCTPPQPGGSVPVDPSWDIKQVNSMKGAQIFNPGPNTTTAGQYPEQR
jgi:glucose dehydrogenase